VVNHHYGNPAKKANQNKLADLITLNPLNNADAGQNASKSDNCVHIMLTFKGNDLIKL
jgi:hypothetical protein